MFKYISQNVNVLYKKSVAFRLGSSVFVRHFLSCSSLRPCRRSFVIAQAIVVRFVPQDSRTEQRKTDRARAQCRALSGTSSNNSKTIVRQDRHALCRLSVSIRTWHIPVSLRECESDSGGVMGATLSPHLDGQSKTEGSRCGLHVGPKSEGLADSFQPV